MPSAATIAVGGAAAGLAGACALWSCGQKPQSPATGYKVLAVNDDLPIRTDQPIHSGKVRAVYWLTAADSARLIAERGYDVAPGSELAVMVISDRISAYEIIWRGEGGMSGCPGKGAALNAISNHWFKLFKEQGLASSHILEVPHPLVWIVQRAQPVMIEAICRQYITGSMWRDYAKGGRNFCGIDLPDTLEKDQKLPELLVTPSTKGILKGIPGVPEQDDVNVSRADILANHDAFGFASAADIDVYEKLLKEGFGVISEALAGLDQIFVDTKFEFGYAVDARGERKLIYMDEVGTPDSSRIWDGPAYRSDGETEARSVAICWPVRSLTAAASDRQMALYPCLTAQFRSGKALLMILICLRVWVGVVS